MFSALGSVTATTPTQGAFLAEALGNRDAVAEEGAERIRLAEDRCRSGGPPSSSAEA